ncbi:hypothetical protein OIU78_004132 [Salix suchowensis]|nr:hypothetical protein OIU78_004132 [Salix suchowensis]
MLMHEDGGGLVKHSLFSTRKSTAQTSLKKQGQGHMLLVVQAKGKKGMQARQFQRPLQTPALPKIEDDGNPKFLIFIRAANVYIWYPLSLITGGTTAKIMVAAKDNFLGKYIYKDTIARNIAAVIYKVFGGLPCLPKTILTNFNGYSGGTKPHQNDEKEIQKTAFKQHRVLRSATEFIYGYKLVENGNLRAALSVTDVIELPTQDKLKTVLDKVKDFFGDAKRIFWEAYSTKLNCN